jgi:hypothetical protein
VRYISEVGRRKGRKKNKEKNRSGKDLERKKVERERRVGAICPRRPII